MPQIKVFWGFKYLSEFGVILRVCFGCLMCCFVRLFSHVPLPVFLTHAIQLAQSVGSCVEFETLWPQALLIHCYGVSSCASEHSPPCCFCFLSLYSHMPFPMRPSIDMGDYEPGAILIMATLADPYLKNQLVWMMYWFSGQVGEWE